MASIFANFHEAQRIGSGHLLASCLAPANTSDFPRRLQSLAQLSNSQTVAADVRYHLLLDRTIAIKLPKIEGNAWVEIFVALWTSVKEVVALDNDVPHASWSKVFDLYKEVCTLLIRGYSNHGFQAWTVPCLYTTGKYLRLYAIKADEEGKGRDSGVAFGDGFSDDVMGNSGKHERLEQAAWTINRMFTICLTDRYGRLMTWCNKSGLTNHATGRSFQNLANGLSTAPPISSSRRTSSSTQSASVKT